MKTLEILLSTLSEKHLHQLDFYLSVPQFPILPFSLIFSWNEFQPWILIANGTRPYSSCISIKSHHSHSRSLILCLYGLVSQGKLEEFRHGFISLYKESLNMTDINSRSQLQHSLRIAWKMSCMYLVRASRWYKKDSLKDISSTQYPILIIRQIFDDLVPIIKPLSLFPSSSSLNPLPVQEFDRDWLRFYALLVDVRSKKFHLSRPNGKSPDGDPAPYSTMLNRYFLSALPMGTGFPTVNDQVAAFGQCLQNFTARI